MIADLFAFLNNLGVYDPDGRTLAFNVVGRLSTNFQMMLLVIMTSGMTVAPAAPKPSSMMLTLFSKVNAKPMVVKGDLDDDGVQPVGTESADNLRRNSRANLPTIPAWLIHT